MVKSQMVKTDARVVALNLKSSSTEIMVLWRQTRKLHQLSVELQV